MTTAILGPSSLDTLARESVARARIDASVQRACARIAPLWPLQHFVACNPYLGLADRNFLDADRLLSQVADSRLRMPRDFYAEALRTGRLGDRHVTIALERVRTRYRDVDWVQRALPVRADVLRERVRGATHAPTVQAERIPTVADLLATQTGTDWPAFVVEQLSQWAGAYFDAGQASWRSPWRDLPPFTAWRTESADDRTAELAGVPGFRRVVRSLPSAARDTIAASVARLGLSAPSLEPYFHRLLMTVPGWVGHARYLEWEAARRGDEAELVPELLAIRLAWEVALLDGDTDRGVQGRWRHACDAIEPSHEEEPSAHDVALLADHVLQEAYELAWQERFVSAVSAGARRAAAGARRTERPAVQAVFCIDVRSEPYRRALESAAAGVETLGFAGFFGVPMEYVPLGAAHGTARCPVLLPPACTVAESAAGVPLPQAAAVAEGVARRRRAAGRWAAFTRGPVASFGFVEALGLARLVPMLRDALGRAPRTRRASARPVRASARPVLAPAPGPREATGILLAHRVQLAENLLRGTSLGEGLSRLVVLVGHGATTTNNPYGSSLDCGACGGHAGDPNARVAAAILNDPEVRLALRDRGMRVPDDTVVVAARHDTTTDEVELLDRDLVPASHADDVARLRAALDHASCLVRAERAPRLGEKPGALTAHALAARIAERARDWSQVRPEWGLAGCAAFVAAPRHRTAQLSLDGRAFLHSYDWRRDEQLGVLEVILTAPMVVASWINLQYFASTVDPEHFGSGNKVLHNVVGMLGVVEGNGGDLRSGLPWQSVHDGERPAHEPLRLNVVVEAPLEAIDTILTRHPSVRQLVDNRWVHLWAMDDSGEIAWRYVGSGAWCRVLGPETMLG